ncbi:uncharacterized protein LOC115670441 [Syzygium oleosum]|uniref:uncharacterized protein LOC115670441 n=1 Tax=Syzygium oleosum TaxID=219896 RepID=UPI0011D2C24C|nr:uncharacterized protein LOC115670441 [Syzygium oleosum]XP_056176000.1 uncharacterized protein LOC115670441 [Syzygium oleosum]
MGVRVPTACLQWSQPIVPQPPSSSQTLASAISSPSSRRRRARSDAGPLLCRYVQSLERSALSGAPPSSTAAKLHRFRSSDYSKPGARTVKRACSASLDDAFSDEEFSKRIQELALRFQLSDDVDGGMDSISADAEAEAEAEAESVSGCGEDEVSSRMNSSVNFDSEHIQLPLSNIEHKEHPWQDERIKLDSSDYEGGEAIIPANIERRANSVDLPLSLRMIKRKMQWKEGFREAEESAYCSVKKAFASMVFIIRELHSFALQMREVLFYEDLQGILARVQREMHASFVWLFQQVFSHTPTLMVYVMILLANFTVYSMGSNAAIAVAPPVGTYAAATEMASAVEVQDNSQQKFDSSTVKTFSIPSSSGKTTSVGGNNGGGGKVRPIASGMDGEGQFHRSDNYPPILPDGASQLSSFGATTEAESVSGQSIREEEMLLWNSMVEEASQMQAPSRDEALDHEVTQKFVSPVTAKAEPDDYPEYFRTELTYQTSLYQDPTNAVLLVNYAQFLYLVARDYDRAEEYFKKAVAAEEPADAEACSKYAGFLWMARNDLWAAEEMYLEAISADPSNSFYAANYAHFLWNTGGEDTCFPLSAPEEGEEDRACIDGSDPHEA